MKLSILLPSLALALSTASPLAAQTLTSWESPVKVTVGDGALTKSAGCEGCPDSGAHSVTRLTGDGYAEFVPGAGARIIAGLGTDLSASTSSSTIDYGFSLWPGGAWEVRERGVYRTDGSFAAGDRFRVAVESGKVVYRRNGAIVYTSTVSPSYPLALDVTLYSLSASLSGATVVVASTDPVVVPPPPPPPDPTAPPVVTTAGPYQAVVDRFPHAKPSLPVIGAAGSTITDPVFGSAITRLTDATTRPDNLDRSYKTPSSPHQNAWSASGSRFYVVGGGGAVLPYTFDANTGQAQRMQASTSGSGGLVLKFYVEPQFSYVNDSIMYGSVSGGSLRTIDQYDFTTSAYTRLLDLDALVPGLSGTYVGGVASSAGPTEKVIAMFGGIRQDLHHYAVVFAAGNPQNRLLLDTTASTLNGNPTSVPLNFLLHHIMIDRSGRYVMLYPTSADQTGPRKAPQSVAWDTQANVFTEMPVSSLPYGHDAFGYGTSVNKDCCTSTSYDAGQWQFRSLASPLVTRDIIQTVLSPKEVYLSDHPTWNNARPDNAAPFISGLYRHSDNTAPWRAWDDEIVAVQTDAAPGAESVVWRFAHHRSDVRNDLDATRTSFWYMPRPNVSPDGHWVLFTSNWEKTLGTDPAGEVGGAARQDVFLVALKSSVPTPPPVVPVTIATTSLPSSRATLAYSAVLQANGGNGAYTWSIASGTLPAGLTLNQATGEISGTPSDAGTATVTILAADATNAANSATAAYTIAITAAPVRVTTGSLPTGRATVSYSALLEASGGSGSMNWSVTAGALPGGLAMNPSTGAITGAPAGAGHFDFTVTVTEAADSTNTAAAAFTIDIAASPLTIAAATLPGGRATIAYSSSVQASGGGGTYVWSVTAGALPAGLTLDGSTGAITGTPAAAGSFTFSVQAADSLEPENAASAACSIVVAAAPVAIATTSVPAGRVTVEYNAPLAASGAEGSFNWAIASGSLPAGLSLSASGIISGTPTTAGTFAFSVTASDPSEATNAATAGYSIAIGSPPVALVTTSLASGRERNAYSATLQASGGAAAIVWSVTGGALPAGLTLNGSTGAITGTPTTAGTYGVTLTASDASDPANAATGVYTIAIAAAVKITSPRTIPAAVKGVPYSYTVLTANAQGTVKWDLAGGSLPPGISLDAATGVISGTCVKSGTWHFNARVKDVNTNDTLTLTLKVQ